LYKYIPDDLLNITDKSLSDIYKNIKKQGFLLLISTNHFSKRLIFFILIFFPLLITYSFRLMNLSPIEPSKQRWLKRFIPAPELKGSIHIII